MILITGGAGYIGAHLSLTLKDKKIIVFDWAENNGAILKNNGINVEKGDCTKHDDVSRIFRKYKITSVIHMAAYKDVGESVDNPVDYFYNNINSLTTVLDVMKLHDVNKIVFSSSCSVYGECEGGDETTPYNPKSPYALSKKICEEIIINSGINYSILRYFNPIGEYDGLKDFSSDSLQNKMKQDSFYIYGNDYDTPDGTPIRDFIDIKDLINAHVDALEWDNEIVNVGTGKPKSVLQMATEMNVKYEFSRRRDGDIPKIWANTDKWKSLKK